MNTKHIAFTVILSLLITVSFSSCKKEEIEAEEYPTHHFGKWQLVAVEYRTETFELISADYSHANIIYDFRENNILVVSGEIEDIEDYRGHEIGEHPYKAFPIPTFNLWTMKIEGDILSYSYNNYVLPSVMRLNSQQPDNLLKGSFTLERME